MSPWGLSGRLWPLRPKPAQDELLSSWLVRIVRSYGMGLHTFCSHALPGFAIWNRDIDRCAGPALLNLLSVRTGTPLSRVRATTLRDYEGAVFVGGGTTATLPWLLPVGVYHRLRRRRGLQFCPRCLAEPRIYFRRRWRLAFVTVCSAHNRRLLDACAECDSPLTFHRTSIDKSLAYCFHCGQDLRTIDAPVLDSEGRRVAAYQDLLLLAVEEGSFEVAGHGRVYSVLYLAGLHQVVKLLTGGRHMERLQRLVCSKTSHEAPKTEPRRDFERLQVARRFELMAQAEWLLADWPGQFVATCIEARCWSSELFRDMRYLPFWYWKVARHLNRSSYFPSDEEVINAWRFLARGGAPVTAKAVARLLGVRDIIRKHPARRAQLPPA